MKRMIRTLVMVLPLAAAMALKAQVPLLSSHPSAQAVLFLDFDGHTVAGTSWNYNGPIVCGASGLDNSRITEVFNRVSEDYRPFNINVTTDSARFLAAPAYQRMRVIITVTSSWYGAAGGVAFVGSFTWGDDNPCFVFSALLNYNVKNIAEAAAHEAGHTLGLFHQSSYDTNCNKLSDYNSGTGTGEIGWAPIMGVGYYRNLTLWNNGPNSYGCTNYQSDLEVITSDINGFGYRNDDFGNTFSGASLVNFSNNEFTASGIIEKNTDMDVFKFNMLANGRFQLDAVPYNVGTGNVGSDLDLQVTLYNNSQTVLNVYNPGTLLSSLVDTMLNPGTYYIRVEGKGNQFAPNYASLGSYSLHGIATPNAVLALRKLELNGRKNGDKHEFTWTIDADEAIEEQILEVSTDGRNFVPLFQPDGDTRAYIYRPHDGTPSQYRLNVLFAFGKRHYSNVVTILPQTAAQEPQLVGTVVTTGTIVVTSPRNYNYYILDINGKVMSKGEVTSGVNHIQAGDMKSGLYMIRLADNTQQWTYKFIRQ